MKLDGSVICALLHAAERCGGAVNLGRRSGVDPSCISRYLRGKVASVSDENWRKLQQFLQTAGNEPFQGTAHPVIEWCELQNDPGLLRRNGVADELVFRAQGLQMAPQICDRDLIVVRHLENLKAVPENKIVVAVFKSFRETPGKAVCKRFRRINGSNWFFSDEPHGRYFSAEYEEIFWVGVVLRKICEL